DLHAARAADPGVRDVAVARDLVRGVHDDNALPHLVREHARDLAQEGRLADAGPPEEQDAASRFDHVADDLHRSVDRAPDAERQTDHFARAVAERADAVERPLDAGAVVPAELTYARDHERDALRGHLPLRDALLAAGEARFGHPPEVRRELQAAAQTVE